MADRRFFSHIFLSQTYHCVRLTFKKIKAVVNMVKWITFKKDKLITRNTLRIIVVFCFLLENPKFLLKEFEIVMSLEYCRGMADTIHHAPIPITS